VVAQAIFRAVDEAVLDPAQLEASKARLDQWRALLEREPVLQEPPPMESIAHAAIDALGKASTAAAVTETEVIVQAGQTLSQIARQHKVAVEQIQHWNNLRDGNVRAGQKLVLRLPLSQANLAAAAPPPLPPADEAEGGDGAEEEEAEAQNDEEVLAAEPESAPEPEPPLQNYTVVKGDAMRRIADRFGTTPDTIMRLNGITDPNRIVVGQTLKVPAQAN
jgi:LysM repeat protein